MSNLPQWVRDEIKNHPESTYMRESMREVKARRAVGHDPYTNMVEKRLERLERMITMLLSK